MLFNQSSKGFTLIEASVVSGILTVVATVSIMSFHTAISKTAVKEAQSTILSALYKARSEAINGYSENGMGVRIEPTEITLFSGESFDNTGLNWKLPKITKTNLTATDIVFSRLNGNANGNWTIEIQGPENISTQIIVTEEGIITPTNERL